METQKKILKSYIGYYWEGKLKKNLFCIDQEKEEILGRISRVSKSTYIMKNIMQEVLAGPQRLKK